MTDTANSAVTLRVTDAVTYVIGKLSKEIYQEFKKTLGYKDPNAMWRSTNAKNWDGYITTVCYNKQHCKCSIKKDGVHFPTGLYSRAVDFFKAYCVPVSVIDDRSAFVANKIPIGVTSNLEVRDYQRETIDKAVIAQRGIIKAATGAGKTAIGSGIIAKLGISPFIFYVTSQDLLRQAKTELERFLVMNNNPLEVGVIGGGKCDIRDVNIMTVQTAVRSLGEKFNKFDDEDEDEGKELSQEMKDKYDTISNLIHSAKGIICDECVTGDTFVTTRNYGIIKIKELKNKIGEEVLSFNGTSVVWKKITKFYDQGIKSIISIKLKSGNVIKCTKNHPIFTQRGWIQSGQLKITDQILSIANADVDQKYQQKEEALVDIQNIYWDIKSKRDLIKSGCKNLKTLQKRLLCANADVRSKSVCNTEALRLLSEVKDQLNTENSFTAMIKDQMLGNCNYPKLSINQYSELCLETPLLSFHLLEALIQDCNSIMDWFKNHGQSISKKNYIDSILRFGSILMEALEKNLYLVILHAFHVCQKYTKFVINKIKNKLLINGLTESDMQDFLGGYAMTDQETIKALKFIQKDFLSQKFSYAQNGLKIITEKQTYINQKISISHFISQKILEIVSILSLKNTFPSACNTSFVGINKIDEAGEDNVFDITVDETHCFFANNMLVHNCQHWSATTCQIISDHSYNARFKYGLSATPFRDLGDDLLIDACFGKLIAEISASFLIKQNILVRPTIYFVHTRKRFDDEDISYATAYKEGIVENEERNLLIANIAQNMVKQGRHVLILAKHIEHGKTLEALTPNSAFLHGAHSSKVRQNHIDQMRDRKAPITIATSIFDEGVDVKPLDGLILAGSGKSQTRALQRVGRVIRTFQDPLTGFVKKDAYIVDFNDNMKYMLSHSRARRRIYETEPEFIIKDFKGSI